MRAGPTDFRRHYAGDPVEARSFPTWVMKARPLYGYDPERAISALRRASTL